MSRDPTAGEMDDIRRLVSAAGSVDELRRWIKVTRLAHADPKPKRQRGRPPGQKFLDDYGLLLLAALVQQAQPELATYGIMKQIVGGLDKPREHGASPKATAKRLLDRLGGESLAAFRERHAPDTLTFRFNTAEQRQRIDHCLLLLAAFVQLAYPKMSPYGIIKLIVANLEGGVTGYGARAEAIENRLLERLGGKSLAEFMDGCAPGTFSFRFNNAQQGISSEKTKAE
jgi:hypothetical protein